MAGAEPVQSRLGRLQKITIKENNNKKISLDGRLVNDVNNVNNDGKPLEHWHSFLLVARPTQDPLPKENAMTRE